MHQFAAALASFFLSPFNWIILLVIAGFIFRKKVWKRSCWWLALIIFVLFGNQFLLNLYANKWQPAPLILAPGKVFSCGIVPGGFASPDENGKGFFNATADRFIQALTLYKQGYITHILISGGNGKEDVETFREGAWVKEQLIIMGVPDSVIMVEDNSNNTSDNAHYAKQLLDSNHLQAPYLLISSAHHIPRAALLFKKAGVETVAYPCTYLAGRGVFSFGDLFPHFDTLSTWDRYLKEAFGYFFISGLSNYLSPFLIFAT